ncbi:D-hexose-6-phosphate mutarotase [Corynebacterium yudongzhengii]|uniref:glucose-6-phosphate 1-epimerase n=1 Tax=Corynebacterium yudongzhengii TaxID=2080740 RepID=A0A2U1T927_9CORY|nr:D-hexose-6-phosphate mutarotase [Corynebacterium yudongzhengii]AWB82434.1 D-hexose-6-phosphate mutarotase [Corynebacterium yudongzhengii]PWC02511.1 D-hexose-6-phosphate mutarotase [Corynebacterium yudongzhengii]
MTDAENNKLTITDHGATLLSAEHPSGDLLFVSSAATNVTGKAIRGGVPIIFPGFATLLGEPKHGWARTSDWEIEKVADGFRASLENDGLVLGLDAILVDNELKMRLTAENARPDSARVQIGFHPYFAVTDIVDVTVEGLGGATAIDRNTDEESETEDKFTISGEHDKIYQTTEAVTVTDSQRRLTVRAEGHDSVVVWNPGEKLADSFADLNPKEWAKFICVEPALLGPSLEGIMLSPGEINTLEMTVSAEEL